MRWPPFLFATVAVVLPAVACAAPGPLFAGTDTVHLSIRAPLSELQATNGRSSKPVDGTLAVTDTSPETLAIELSTRGITRGNRDICPFPPLRIAFPAKPAPGSLFEGQKSLKLVTHCQSDAAFQHYPLLEYAAYRMYQLLTPASFGVRLASIDYVKRNGQPLATRFGFFIEDIGEVARRGALKRDKAGTRVAIGALSAQDAARFAVFQYMIGNLDWSMTAGPAGSACCHNARLIAAPGATAGLVPVPYDFDFSGIVDAPYATPPEGISMPNVRMRRYRGYCRHNALAQAVAADFLSQRAAILGVLDGVDGLDGFARRKASRYLNDFFDQIATPKGVDAMLKTCLS